MNTFGFEKSRGRGEDVILKESENGFIIQSNKSNSKLYESDEEPLNILHSSLEGYCYTTDSAVMCKIKKMFEDYYDDLEISSFLYDEKTSKAIASIINKNKTSHKDTKKHGTKIQHSEKEANKEKSKNKEKNKGK